MVDVWVVQESRNSGEVCGLFYHEKDADAYIKQMNKMPFSVPLWKAGKFTVKGQP